MSSPRGRPTLAAAVVDASVIVKHFLEEKDSDLAAELMLAGGGGTSAYRCAPQLLCLECGNIFWKSVGRGLLRPTEAIGYLRDLMELGVDLWPDEILADRALGLALRYGISVYDAAYVALADLLDLPFVTADERLLRRIGGSSDRYLLLADLR